MSKSKTYLIIVLAASLSLFACGDVEPTPTSKPAVIPWATRTVTSIHVPFSRTFTGEGGEVTALFLLGEGLVRFEYGDRGEMNFIVWLYTSEGRMECLVANETTGAEGSSACGIPGGQYYLDVACVGPCEWAIEVTQ